MKKTLLTTMLALAVLSNSAGARTMNYLDLMDPGSMKTWQNLSEADKVASVKTYLEFQPPENKAYLVEKIKYCLDREASDPDYKDMKIPLMGSVTYCMAKYGSIVFATQVLAAQKKIEGQQR